MCCGGNRCRGSAVGRYDGGWDGSWLSWSDAAVAGPGTPTGFLGARWSSFWAKTSDEPNQHSCNPANAHHADREPKQERVSEYPCQLRRR